MENLEQLKEKYKKYLKEIWGDSNATIKESYYFYLQEKNSEKLQDKNYFPSSLEEIINDEGFLEDYLTYCIENEPDFIKENLL